MKKLILMFGIIGSMFLLAGCVMEESEELSAYDELTELETAVFDAFILNIDSFYNPTKVRFLGFSNYFEDIKSTAFKIQGTNRLGGTITNWYVLQVYDNAFTILEETNYYTKGEMYEASGEYTISSDVPIDVGKLNRALIEYWEDKGI